jgi:hypothetical protein
MWGGGIVVTILLLFVSWMLLFGPAATEDGPDHRPPHADATVPRDTPEVHVIDPSSSRSSITTEASETRRE